MKDAVIFLVSYVSGYDSVFEWVEALYTHTVLVKITKERKPILISS